MIICTRTADALCRQALDKNQVIISKFESMLESFKIDPAITKPTKDAFIVTSDDVKQPRVLAAFKDAAGAKHPNTRIIFISKNPKQQLDCPGVDAVMSKPKPGELRDKVYEITSSAITAKPVVKSSSDATPTGIEKFKPNYGETFTPETPDESVAREVPPIVVAPAEPEAPVAVVPFNEMAERIRQASGLASVHALTKELKASNIIKELAAKNSEYATIESKLRALNEKILVVMVNATTPFEEKMESIRALLVDKDYYQSKNNTIIEQYVEAIINTLTEKSTDLVRTRMGELDRSIVASQRRNDSLVDYGRIAGLTDERANVILEVATIQQELQNIMNAANSVALESAAIMSDKQSDLTGSDLLNAQIRSTGSSIISGESLDAIVGVLETYERNSPKYADALLQIKTMLNKVNKLFDLDKETIVAQTEVLKFLRAQQIEDTVVALSLLKRSLRIFVGYEGCGRTAIPLIVSAVKSRENANVLLVDITGASKLKDYGVSPYPLEDFIVDRVEKEFCVVAGEVVSEDIGYAQRLLVCLTKAADYYRVINLVMTPEQKTFFETLIQDVLCVNYIVDTEKLHMDEMARFIATTKTDNVAQRVIVNKCSIGLRTIVQSLGLDGRIDINIRAVPYVPQVVDCALRSIKPYDVNAITEAFTEVTRYA